MADRLRWRSSRSKGHSVPDDGEARGLLTISANVEVCSRRKDSAFPPEAVLDRLPPSRLAAAGRGDDSVPGFSIRP
jgi:hypothetical protein